MLVMVKFSKVTYDYEDVDVRFPIYSFQQLGDEMIFRKVEEDFTEYTITLAPGGVKFNITKNEKWNELRDPDYALGRGVYRCRPFEYLAAFDKVMAGIDHHFAEYREWHDVMTRAVDAKVDVPLATRERGFT